ncbi:histidine phosphatase family protein [Nostocoides sp. F2B08]|uniref:histidine phosphatase family protein n=1 Tax=Nostocoides sp. F2B08 TaxID=2653936 RepID=UPI001263CAFB|nr:histidine phosphatase family protein [Tetrasphaera sp. F2B08]KAB7745977.1 histidine phosphatase family protein [Tetrasphaera sp. F2B08]
MSEPARRLVVLRHGESRANREGVWQGQYDSPLTEVGVLQAQAAAKVIALGSPALVVASDLTRAATTGDIVASAAEVTVSYDGRLREIDVGEWTGMSGLLVKERYAVERERHLRGEDFKRGVSGESLSDVQARVRPLLEDVLGRLEPGRVGVLATHGITARVIVGTMLGLQISQMWHLFGGFGNCHWAEVAESTLAAPPSFPVLGGSTWRLQGWNLRAPMLDHAQGDAPNDERRA